MSHGKRGLVLLADLKLIENGGAEVVKLPRENPSGKFFFAQNRQPNCLLGTQRSVSVAYLEKAGGFLAEMVFLLVHIGFVGAPFRRGQLGVFLVPMGVFLLHFATFFGL